MPITPRPGNVGTGTRSFATRLRLRRKKAEKKAVPVSSPKKPVRATGSRKISVRKRMGRKVRDPRERLAVMSSILTSEPLSDRRKVQLIERMILLVPRIPRYSQNGIVREATLRGVVGRGNQLFITAAIRSLVRKGKLMRAGVGFRRVVRKRR
jgi:hypothetical protein